jgi:hypothetical protein
VGSNNKIPHKAYRAAVMVFVGLAVPFAVPAQSNRDEPPGGSTGEHATLHPPKAVEAVREVREAQRLLARETGIAITEYEERGRSTSFVEGLLPELRGLVVANEQQMIDAVIPGIYKYFGFTGTGGETLKFRGKVDFYGSPAYDFHEYINGIETPDHFYVFVDPDSNEVINSGGVLDIGRGYGLVPAMDEQEALDLTLTYIRKRNEHEQHRQNDADNLAAIKSRVVYTFQHDLGGLQPVWLFQMPALDTSTPYLDEYAVFPSGQVEGGGRRM